MTNPAPQQPRPRSSGRQIHRREMRLQVWLPFALAAVLILSMFLMVALPSEPEWRLRAAFIADFMTTILFLCPIFLCGFVFYAVLVAAGYGMHRLYRGTIPPLERLSSLSQQSSEKAQVYSERVVQETGRWSVRLAPLMKMFSIFDEKPGATSPDAQEPRDQQ